MKIRSGHLFKRNGIYYVQWRIDGKLFMKSTGKRDKDEAETERAKIMAPFVAGDTVTTLRHIAAKIEGTKADIAQLEDERTPTLKLVDAWNTYDRAGNRPDSGPRTLAGYKSQFHRFKEWVGSKYPAVTELRQVDAKIANEYANDLKEKRMSASTYNQHIKTLDLIWSVLKMPGKITVNPWAWDKKAKMGMQRLTINKIEHRKKALTLEQIEAILAIAQGDYKDLLTLLAYTGQRLVDIVMLAWDSVDFRKRVITICPRKTERRTGKEVFIPLLPAAESVLLQRRRVERCVFPVLVDEYRHDNGSLLVKKIGAIFEASGLARHQGGPDGTEQEKKAEQKVKKKGKKKEKKGEEPVAKERAVVAYGAHSLRHGFVTIARSAGIPDAVIRQITGHRSTEMVDHYSQFDKALAGALAKKALDGTQPAVAQGGESKALPAPAKWRDEIRSLAVQLNGKTWRTVQAAMEQLASSH